MGKLPFKLPVRFCESKQEGKSHLHRASECRLVLLRHGVIWRGSEEVRQANKSGSSTLAMQLPSHHSALDIAGSCGCFGQFGFFWLVCVLLCFLYFCLFACLPACLLVCLSVGLPARLPARLFVCLLFVCLVAVCGPLPKASASGFEVYYCFVLFGFVCVLPDWRMTYAPSLHIAGCVCVCAPSFVERAELCFFPEGLDQRRRATKEKPNPKRSRATPFWAVVFLLVPFKPS